MRRVLFVASLAACISFISYRATVYTLAQIEEKRIGTPECTAYTDQSGTACYELKCKFTGSDNPGNFDSCESSGGGQNFSINKCKYSTCPQPSDTLTCTRQVPPYRSPYDNSIVYRWTDCFGVEKLDQSELICPVKCRKCLTRPNAYGLCPNGYVKANNCCWPRNIAGYPGGCNGPTLDDGSCETGFVESGGICTRSAAFIQQCFQNGGDYDDFGCGCTGSCQEGGSCSPIVVDVLGNGLSLTNANNGVNFNLDYVGEAERLGWITSGSDDAWLVLDRNNDGVIDSGKELFGNVTAQEPAPQNQMNGFRALALFDGAGYGGNGDGKINRNDAIFDRLRLWRDDNHNGISESCELFLLRDLGLRRIDLDYRESQRVDAHGNQFKFRSRVYDSDDAQLGRWAWDVFLVVQQ